MSQAPPSKDLSLPPISKPESECESGIQNPRKAAKKSRLCSLRKLFLRSLGLFLLLIILAIAIAWWQRIPLSQWAIERYFESQNWQAQAEVEQLDFAQGAKLNLLAKHDGDGAQLELSELAVNWSWHLSWQEQRLELKSLSADSLDFTWDEQALSWQELRKFGQISNQQDSKDDKQEQEENRKADELEPDAKDSALSKRFALANDFLVTIQELRLNLQGQVQEQPLQGSWQSGLSLQAQPEEPDSWQVLLQKPDFELAHPAYGQLKTRQLELLSLRQSPTSGQTLSTQNFALKLSSLPAPSPFEQVQWQGDLKLHLSQENQQKLQLSGQLLSPAVEEFGLSQLSLEHQIEALLIDRKLEEASLSLNAGEFLWNEQALQAQAQGALIWENAKLSALSLELTAADVEQADSPWKLQLNGAGQEQQGILNFLLAQGSKRPLRGEGSWNRDKWKLDLAGQVPLQPRWFSPLLGQALSAENPLQLQLSESSLLRLQNFKLSGQANQLQHADGQLQLRDLAVNLDDYDAGMAIAEAKLSYLPDKGLLFPLLRINLPALQARGALLFSQSNLGNQGKQDSEGKQGKNAPSQIKGWGWQIELYEIGPIRQYHPALEVLDGNAQIDRVFLSLQPPTQPGERGEFHLSGQLSRAEISSFEPLYSLSGISAPQLGFRYGSPPKPAGTPPEPSKPEENQQKPKAYWEVQLPLVGIAEANIQEKLKLNELRTSLQVRPQNLEMEGLQFQGLKGKLSLDRATIPLPAGEWFTTLRWKEVDLAEIAALIPNFEGSLEGRINGYLPLAFEGFELKKEFQGGLSLTPGFEARMSAKPQGILNLEGHQQAARAEAILADYLIRELDGVLLPADDESTLMKLKIRGEGRQTPGELSFNIPVTTDDPELTGSLWKWLLYFLEGIELQ